MGNNDQLLGTAFPGAVRVPLDSLEEFKVTTGNTDADAGRSSGARCLWSPRAVLTNSRRIVRILPSDLYRGQRVVQEINSSRSNIPPFLLRNTFGAFVSDRSKSIVFFLLAAAGFSPPAETAGSGQWGAMAIFRQPLQCELRLNRLRRGGECNRAL